MWELLLKTVGKAFLMTLVDRMSIVCKAVIKANGGYFDKSEYQISNIIKYKISFD
jgi:hypothetical protein